MIKPMPILEKIRNGEISVKAVCVKTGLSPYAVKTLVACDDCLSAKTLDRICKAFNCQPCDLMEFKYD